MAFDVNALIPSGGPVGNMAGQAAATTGDPTNPVGKLTGTLTDKFGADSLVGRMVGQLGDKNKGGAQNVPLASPNQGFYQPVNTAGRAGLLQAMMQRSRGGRAGMPATPATAPVAPTTGY